MKIPELYKDMEIDGDKYRIKKMDARTSSYLLFKLTKIITPLLKKINKDKIELEDINLTELVGTLFTEFSKEEFEYIQDNCLKVCFAFLPAGEQAIYDGKNWGIQDIQYNTPLILQLTGQALWFNLKGFFPEGALNSLSQKLTTFQQDLKI